MKQKEDDKECIEQVSNNVYESGQMAQYDDFLNARNPEQNFTKFYCSDRKFRLKMPKKVSEEFKVMLIRKHKKSLEKSFKAKKIEREIMKKVVREVMMKDSTDHDFKDDHLQSLKKEEKLIAKMINDCQS